jgi:23S rRNA pseudouridine2605 synthase
VNLTIAKYIAHAGLCSRRRAIDLVKTGCATINNVVVTEPWKPVTKSDLVRVNGSIVVANERTRYILLNKPKDCITTTADERGRFTVVDLLKKDIPERLYPIGRLDRNTTGVLLLTNDGGLAHRLMHPSFEVQKTYHVTIDRSCSVKDVEALRKGVLLEDGVLKCDRVLVVPGTKKELFLTIHSGKYRVIRRAFESLGYTVLKLNRSLYAGLTTRKMVRGEWRDLTQSEVQRLKQLLN